MYYVLTWASFASLFVLLFAVHDARCSGDGEVNTWASTFAGGPPAPADSAKGSYTPGRRGGPPAPADSAKGSYAPAEEEFTSVLQLSVAVDHGRPGLVAAAAAAAAAPKPPEGAPVAEIAEAERREPRADGTGGPLPRRSAESRPVALEPRRSSLALSTLRDAELGISWLTTAVLGESGVPASTWSLIMVLLLLFIAGAIIILYDYFAYIDEGGPSCSSSQSPPPGNQNFAPSSVPTGHLAPQQFPRLSSQRPTVRPSHLDPFSRPSTVPTPIVQRPSVGQAAQAPPPLHLPVSRRVSLMSDQAPSPRRMAQSSLSKPGIDQKLFLCERNIWAHFEAFFSIRAEQLPAEFGKVGDFDVLRGTLLKPVFHGSVRLLDRGRRVLVLSATATDTLLASCRPSPGSCSIVDGYAVEPCSELQIRNKDNVVWGTVAPRAQDSYGVFQGEKQVFSLQGDQEAGRLIAYLEGEPIAHAARSASCEHLEVGVKPHIDPILMLIVFMSVVIFNPEEDVDNS